MQTTELEDKLSTLAAPRVTKEAIEKRIANVRYLRDETTTICIIVLDNGFKSIGTSTPASSENFREDIGQHYAYEDAFRPLWKLFGFALVEQLKTA